MCKNYGEKGQALLIVVLIMVVSLTIGLSVATRSITNVRNSTEEADSQKAFSAAEAGVEQALKGVTPNPNVNFSGTEKIPAVNIVPQGGTSGVNTLLLNGGDSITKDEGVDLWLADHRSSDGSIDYSTVKNNWSLSVDWENFDNALDCSSSSITTATAAIEIIVIYGTSPSDAKFTKYTADPDCHSDRGNGFSLGSTFPSPGKDYGTIKLKYSTDIGTITNGIVVRIIPLYEGRGTVIGVRCDDNATHTHDCSFPEQGNLISSTGQSGQAQRKIQVFQQKYPSLPAEFFRYALLAP